MYDVIFAARRKVEGVELSFGTWDATVTSGKRVIRLRLNAAPLSIDGKAVCWQMATQNSIENMKKHHMLKLSRQITRTYDGGQLNSIFERESVKVVNAY